MIKEVTLKEKDRFDSLASHPLQSWSWGNFREQMGIKVIRLGRFDQEKLIETAQITFHPIPKTYFKIGYFPKGQNLSPELIEGIYKIGRDQHCIFIKFEPNVPKEKFLHLKTKYTILPSSHPLFTQFSFQLDLSPTEDKLLNSFHSKTRYNIKVAQKHQIKITEESDKYEAYKAHLDLMFATAKRQEFFAHDRHYHTMMWECLKKDKIAHLLQAHYSFEGKDYLLASWVLFVFNNVLYYPYGASSNQFRNTMASNMIMWEAIKFGKKKNLGLFDMWGSLGPDPDPSDPWFGFHRFKQGYGAQLVEFAGSFDLLIYQSLYKAYNHLFTLRKIFLTAKRKLSNT